MKINSSKAFRTWVKNEEHRPEVDENFMGCQYVNGQNYTHGFFNLYHGAKNDIAGYLRPRLDLAQDNQAIYEFVQNAADCKATRFYSFWNEDYFLVCNNGSKFDLKGLKSILNEGQSTKDDPNSIGRYGVGFKIIHRLVGKKNGLEEIMKNCGPILFSWNKKDDLLHFMNQDAIELLEKHDKEAPFLLKILLTNFPSDVDEMIYNSNHEEQVVFTQKELTECQQYVYDCLNEHVRSDLAQFEQGSIFFMRLGENKKSYLDDNYRDFSDGISYSMNTLKQLNTICINNTNILKKQLCIEESSILVDSEIFNKLTIDEKYKDFDVKYAFGFIPYKDRSELLQLEALKSSPNFYKFFPFGDEINKFALFLHCDTFSSSSSRRSLDNTEHNKVILGEMAKFIIATLERYKKNDFTKYCQLFAAILLTDRPEAQNNKWMDSIFYQPLLTYIKQNTPTTLKTFLQSNFVKIKGTSLNINPAEVGATYDWFIYDSDKDCIQQKAACNSSLLGLQVKDAKALVKEGTATAWNTWISENPDLVPTLLEEIKNADSALDFSEKLKNLKFFSSKTGIFTYNEINHDDSKILLSENTYPIKDILEKLGFECTNEVLDSTHPLSKHITKTNEKHLFSLIANKFNQETILTFEEKIRLIKNKFDDIGDESIKKLKLFRNQEGDSTVLQDMLPYQVSYPNWLGKFVIHEKDYSSDLDKYLMKPEDIFNRIVINHYSDLLSTLGGDNVKSWNILFENFKDKWTDSFTDSLISIYGADERLLSIVEASRAKQEAFLRKLSPITLSADIDYSYDSYEYRVLKFSTISSTNIGILKEKIVIGDKSLKQHTVKDTITINRFKEKPIVPITLHLSEILPEMNLTGEFSKIANKYPEFASLFEKEELTLNQIYEYLKNKDGKDFLYGQRACLMLHAGCHSSSNCHQLAFNYFRDIENYIGFMNYMFEKGDGWHEIIKHYHPVARNFAIGAYIFSNMYTIQSERVNKLIEEWVGYDEKKLSFIKLFGFKDNTAEEIIRRKKFFDKEPQDYKISDNAINLAFLEWAVSMPVPFVDKNQVNVLYSICKSGSLIKETIDSDKLVTNSSEWENVEYKKWSEAKQVKIYLYEGEIPYYGAYNGLRLYDVNQYDYKFCILTKVLYINRLKDIETLLANVADDTSIPIFTKEDWNDIFKATSELAITQAKEIQKLRDENEQLRRAYEELKNQGKETTRGNNDSKTQQEYSRAYCKFACEELEKQGYDCSGWKEQEYGPDTYVFDPAGNKINVVCRGIGSNKLHLSAKSFQHLLANRNSLLIIIKDNQIHTTKFEDIFTMTSDVNMVFKVANTPLHYFEALTKIFKDIPGSTFVIDNPNYSAAGELEGFGLEIRNDGELVIANENMLPE